MRVIHRAAPSLVILLAACATPATRVATAPAPPPYVPPPGLARVIGKPPAAVIALLGVPRLDRTEGRTRQLQYRGAACILDLFAVAPAGVVGYVEARTPKGLTADPVACLEELAARR